ncbi:MAG: hypothetical protein P8Z40_05190 [Chloroflexota bacterium]
MSIVVMMRRAGQIIANPVLVATAWASTPNVVSSGVKRLPTVQSEIGVAIQTASQNRVKILQAHEAGTWTGKAR